MSRRYLLEEELVPTPLDEDGAVEPLEIAPVEKPSFFRFLVVTKATLEMAAKLLGRMLRRRSDPREQGVIVRSYLEVLGGLWLKVGQLLALRLDLFPSQFCDELSRLQERARGFPPEMARAIVERELGRPIEEVFCEYEELPFAAASLSQVHRARLISGEEVAVKIQKPYAEEFYRYDSRWLRLVFGLFELLRVGPNFHWREMLIEVDDLMQQELDYRREIAAIDDLARTLRRHRVYVPRVASHLSTARLLIMELLRGVTIANFLAAERDDPERVAAWMSANGIDRKKVAVTLFQSVFRQIFEDNLCHGDLHPGNIVLLRNSRIAFLDFGAVGSYPADFIFLYGQYMRELTNKHYHVAADYMLMLTGPLPPVDIEMVRKELVASMRAWGERARATRLPFHQRSLSASSDEIGQITLRYRFPVNWSMLKLGRTYVTLDLTVGAIYPAMDYPRELRRYAEQARSRLLIKSMAGLAGLPEALSTASFLASRRLRGAIIAISSARDRIDLAIGSLFTAFRHACWLAFALLLLVFLIQRFPSLVPALPDPAHRWMAGFPQLSGGAWALVIAAALYALVRTHRFVTRLHGAPPRAHSTS